MRDVGDRRGDPPGDLVVAVLTPPPWTAGCSRMASESPWARSTRSGPTTNCRPHPGREPSRRRPGTSRRPGPSWAWPCASALHAVALAPLRQRGASGGSPVRSTRGAVNRGRRHSSVTTLIDEEWLAFRRRVVYSW